MGAPIVLLSCFFLRSHIDWNIMGKKAKTKVLLHYSQPQNNKTNPPTMNVKPS